MGLRDVGPREQTGGRRLGVPPFRSFSSNMPDIAKPRTVRNVGDTVAAPRIPAAQMIERYGATRAVAAMVRWGRHRLIGRSTRLALATAARLGHPPGSIFTGC